MDESSIVHIITIVFASIVIVIVLLSSFMFIFIRCRRSSECSSGESDTSDRTEDSFYQVREQLCEGSVAGTNRIDGRHPFIKVRDGDALSREALFQRTLLLDRNGQCL